MALDTPISTPDTVGILSTVAPSARLQGNGAVSVPIDGRSRLGRTYRRVRGALVQSLGGPENLSEQQALLIRQAAEAEALRAVEFARATRGQDFSPKAWASYAKVSKDALKEIGLKRVPKDVLDLHTYMKSAGGTSAG